MCGGDANGEEKYPCERGRPFKGCTDWVSMFHFMHCIAFPRHPSHTKNCPTIGNAKSSFILTPFLYYQYVYKSLKYPAPDGHHFFLSRYLKVGLYLICQRKTLNIAGANKISLDNQISLLGIRYLKFQDLSPPMIIHAPQLL